MISAVACVQTRRRADNYKKLWNYNTDPINTDSIKQSNYTTVYKSRKNATDFDAVDFVLAEKSKLVSRLNIKCRFIWNIKITVLQFK